jgi:probable phosphoglycerate mutase
MTKFLLIRHAANDFLDRTLAGRLPNVCLNATGRQQAERLPDRLAGESIQQIYSSPLERAQETAQPLARRLGLEVRTAPELMELDFGDWTGRAIAEMVALPEWRQYNAFRSGCRIPNGELMIEVQARVVVFMQKLCAQHPGQAIALVSHGDVIKAALMHYLGIPIDFLARFEVGPASVSALTIWDHGPQVHYINRAEAWPGST